jgi:hypothetical protein
VRPPSRLGPILLLACLLEACALPIIGSPRSHRDDAASMPEATPAQQRARAELAAMPPATCYERLRTARVPFEPVAPDRARGVNAPLRLQGPIDGVEVTSRNGETLNAVLDCRLALALLAWAPSLRAAGVRRLEHYSIYRPGARTSRHGKLSGHARGLAIDAARFHMMQGGTLDVLTDWEERDRGGAPCPQRSHEARPSRVLRSMVCDAVARNLFQVVLTPHHDRAHENHVHLELKPEVSWTYVR